MTRIGDAAAATPGLVFKGAILLIGTAIILGLFVKQDGAPPASADAPGDERISVRSEAGNVRVTLNVADNQAFSSYLFQDTEGKELLTVNLYKNGSAHFFWGDAIPVRAAGSMANGIVGFGVGIGRGVIQVSQRAGPDGSSIVEVRDPEGRVMGRFRTTAEGLSTQDLTPEELQSQNGDDDPLGRKIPS